MKKIPVIFLRLFFFWLLFFQIARLIFLLWNRNEFSGCGFWGTMGVFFHAVYLDTAMTSYFLILPYLLFTLALFFEKEFFLKISKYFTIVLIVMVSMITMAELPIYDEWHTKLTFKAISYLAIPSEVVHTASGKQLFFGVVAISLLSWLGIFLLRKLVPIKIELRRKPYWQSISFALLTPFFVFTGMRGGYYSIPIQVSDAVFSKKNILNITAENSTFNLLSNCIENFHAGEPYNFMPHPQAVKIFAEINAIPKDTTIHVLTTDRPNVVLVVLEGWSADLVKSCGGYDSITPHFDELAKDGILFTNCYASGSLSDQGMAAIFSAFPSQPKTSIITQPAKYVHLPCINTVFKNAGYYTSYMFGGQLSYGNIRSYMYYNAFDSIIEDKNFDPSLPRGKLGVADQYLFDRQLQQLATEKQPFFAGMFTESTHGPFDFPMNEVLHWGDKEKPYINSALYSDKCIYNFMEAAKKFPWYKNTLFVFVSDHSHNSPKNWAFNQKEYRHIPMLFYGDVIKEDFRGMKYDSIASQTDLASTLLHQLNLDATPFHYSKNLFNPYSPHSAYYAFDEGFGWVAPQGHLTWYVKDGRTEYEEYNSPQDKGKLKLQGQAFLEYLMDEYFRF
jgi:phosphoglycerol transferase MdoB-like AlkP superfamily enzyme